jgi:Ni/Co efflux regulator RcnB
MEVEDRPVMSMREFRKELAWHQRLNNQFALISTMLGIIFGYVIGRF